MNGNTPVRSRFHFDSRRTAICRLIGRSRLAYKASIIAAALFFGGMAGLGRASIVQFDQIRDTSGNVIPTISGRSVEPDYGDRITGSVVNVPGGQFTYGNGGEGFTPNIVADFFAGSALPNNPGVSLWNSEYGDLTNVLIGNNNSLSLNVRLTADAGFDVQLYGFDLAGWPITDYTIKGVYVSSGANMLFSQNNVFVQGSGPGHTSFNFATPWTGAEILITIDYGNLGGNQQDNIGIDTIRFGQNPPAAVPLPAAWLFLGSGVAATAFLRRRLRGSGRGQGLVQ